MRKQAGTRRDLLPTLGILPPPPDSAGRGERELDLFAVADLDVRE